MVSRAYQAVNTLRPGNAQVPAGSASKSAQRPGKPRLRPLVQHRCQPVATCTADPTLAVTRQAPAHIASGRRGLGSRRRRPRQHHGTSMRRHRPALSTDAGSDGALAGGRGAGGRFCSRGNCRRAAASCSVLVHAYARQGWLVLLVRKAFSLRSKVVLTFKST